MRDASPVLCQVIFKIMDPGIRWCGRSPQQAFPALLGEFLLEADVDSSKPDARVVLHAMIIFVTC